MRQTGSGGGGEVRSAMSAIHNLSLSSGSCLNVAVVHYL